MKAIEFIFQELNNGRIFAEHITSVKYPYLWDVLYLTPHNYIGFTHAGSSAVPNTINNLAWVLKNIFNMSAEEFLERYASVTADYLTHYEAGANT